MIRAALVVLVVMCAMGVVARPASAHSGTWQVNAGNGLNLRTGPGGSYARIETMANGTYVKARGHSGNWMKLTSYTTGNTGWAWLAYLVPAGGSSGSTPAAPSGLQRCFFNYWGQTPCAADWVAQTIYNAAVRYGASYWALMSVAACESDFVIYAYNGGGPVYGIFQFRWETFYGNGGWDGIYSVYAQADVAARMFARGLAWQWDCANRMGIA